MRLVAFFSSQFILLVDWNRREEKGSVTSDWKIFVFDEIDFLFFLGPHLMHSTRHRKKNARRWQMQCTIISISINQIFPSLFQHVSCVFGMCIRHFLLCISSVTSADRLRTTVSIIHSHYFSCANSKKNQLMNEMKGKNAKVSNRDKQKMVNTIEYFLARLCPVGQWLWGKKALVNENNQFERSDFVSKFERNDFVYQQHEPRSTNR